MTFEEKQVQAALSALDPMLFLDKRWSPLSGIYYCACRRMEDGSEPFVAVDWRQGTHPLPLSLDLVDRVRSQEGSISETISLATAHNAARKELARQERLKRQDEAVEDWQKSKPGKASIVVDKPLAENKSK